MTNADRPGLRCAGCGKTPDELEYAALGEEEGMSADDWCRENEGTLNEATGQFLCDSCYITAGCPSLPAPAQWKVPS